MPDHDLDTRLRAALTAEAARVSPQRVADRLPVDVFRAPDRTRRLRPIAPVLAAAGVAAVATAASLLVSTLYRESTVPHPADRYRASLGAGDLAASTGPTVTYVRVDGSGTGRHQPIDTWIPADRAGTWQLTQPGAGHFTVQRARCAAFPEFLAAAPLDVAPASGPAGRVRSGSAGMVPNCDQGSWEFYRPRFFEALPADPAAVLQSLRAATDGDVDAFDTAWQLLGSGWVQPAAVRKIVAALRRLDGVTTSRDGRTLRLSGRLKPTVVEHWSVTVDASGTRVIGTGFSYGTTAPITTTLTYRAVHRLGQR